MTSVTSGMAIRLASVPTIETCWKITSVSGVRPSVAMSWVRRPARIVVARRAGQPRQPAAAGTPARRGCVAGDDDISSATAMNDSQKPGCVNAQGSSSVTTAAAMSRTNDHGQRNPADCKTVTVASIQTVRWVGTLHPANTAYAVAAARPPQRAALAVGSRCTARALRRQATPTTRPASQANIVTCKPLMDIRWATPVLRNTSQSSRSIAPWSPTASAARTPAARRSSTWA